MRKMLISILLAVGILTVPAQALAWSEFTRMKLNSTDYYYTPSQTNVLAAKAIGYKWEGFLGYVKDAADTDTQPLYQAYHVNSGRHLYTNSLSEYNGLPGSWTKEGISAHVSATLTSDTKKLYRVRMQSNNRYLYTSSKPEKDSLVAAGNFYEGLMGYVYHLSPEMVTTYQHPYSDGRPSPAFRLPASDDGIVLAHGSAADLKGARDAWVYEEDGTYYMTYDGATNTKWSVNLANSTDLSTWAKQGSIVSETTSCGCYGTIHKNGSDYVMYYLGSPSQQTGGVPNLPYNIRKAHSSSLTGPWTKDGDQFSLTSYYTNTATPGPIIEHNGEQLMFFSSSDSNHKRTIGIARATSKDGPWTPDANPILPVTEQIENASIIKQGDTYYMFVNHVGKNSAGEYTDSIWTYWSDDLESWDANNKAVVIDGQVSFSKVAIGLPAVIESAGRIAILYDGNEDMDQGHLNRDIGLAWVELPIVTP